HKGIVSKRLGSTYRSGRSRHWIKSKNPKHPAVKREAEEDWARRLLTFVAKANLPGLRTNGTFRIWSNSHFRRKAFAVFSKRLMRSIVNDASRSAAPSRLRDSAHNAAWRQVAFWPMARDLPTCIV